jgi:hypothetical protein
MTEEQLLFFAEESRRAAEKGTIRGIHAYRRQAIIAFVILVLGVGYNSYIGVQGSVERAKIANEAREAIVQSGRVVAVDGCNRDYADRVKFRNLLLRLQAASAVSRTQTPEQRKRSQQFYKTELANYPLIDCRRARDIITDEPDELRTAPEPWYPANPDAPQEIKLPKLPG